MAAESTLTHLYDHVLLNSNNRVWAREIINEMHMLRQKLIFLNERTALQRYLRPDKLQGTTELELISFRDEIAELNDKLGDFGYGTKTTSPDVMGNYHERRVPEEPEDGRFLDLVIESYWSIAKGLRAGATDPCDTQPLYSIIARPATRHQTRGLCHGDDPKDKTPYDLWKQRCINREPPPGAINWRCWRKTSTLENTIGELVFESVNFTDLNSAEKAEEERCLSQWRVTQGSLETAVIKHQHALMDVDKILCFGLGSLDWRRPKSFVQHIAAVTIRNTLYELQSERGITREIPIIAQDPAYCRDCKSTLSSMFPDFYPVTDFECFKKVDKNSLIITVAPSAPVCQIIADLTLDDGGPAAIICDLFGDDYLAQERNPEGGFTCDEPTKNMVEYKKRCQMRELDDVVRVLGMDYEEFLKKYPLPADLDKEWRAKGKDIHTGENITEQEREFYEECKAMWQLEGKINFPQSALYVKPHPKEPPLC